MTRLNAKTDDNPSVSSTLPGNEEVSYVQAVDANERKSVEIKSDSANATIASSMTEIITGPLPHPDYLERYNDRIKWGVIGAILVVFIALWCTHCAEERKREETERLEMEAQKAAMQKAYEREMADAQRRRREYRERQEEATRKREEAMKAARQKASTESPGKGSGSINEKNRKRGKRTREDIIYDAVYDAVYDRVSEEYDDDDDIDAIIDDILDDMGY